MSMDRSNEIQTEILHRRITLFRKYLKEKKIEAERVAKESASNWDNAYAKALSTIYKRSNTIFSGGADGPSVKKPSHKKITQGDILGAHSIAG